MTKNISIRSAIVAALLGMAGVAQAQIAEVEPNNTTATAQRIPSGRATGVTVQGSIGSVGDIDFYSFHAEAGDVLSVNIDHGMTTDMMGLHSTVSILGPTGGASLNVLRFAFTGAKDAGSQFTIPGSTTITWDAKITNFRIAVAGTYIVAVAGYPNIVTTNGGLTAPAGSTGPDANSTGNYTLVITGATPDPIKIINIEIKPGDDNHLAPAINMRSGGKIKVALLSAADFDPFQVRQDSLRFGHSGTEMSLARCKTRDRDDDFNKDGKPDLVCEFYIQSTMFVPTDVEGTLTGEMLDGTKIEGQAPLKVRPADERHHGDHDGDDHDKDDHDRGDGKGRR